MTVDKKIIRDQVRLPLSVALEVVLQGLRTRLGRSIVTISGVVLGIAFLMSILTGQLVKAGVESETQARRETQRMLNFLLAETGPLNDRAIVVHRTGSLNNADTRLIAALESQGTAVQFADATAATSPGQVAATMVMGDGPWPAGVTWIAGTHVVTTFAGQRDVPSGVAHLAREPRPEEITKAETDARKQRFRSLWIIIISLGVTVIGISNAMLMSVTERFREIGTMKCLGALSGFIRRIFLIESSLMGAVGGFAGTILGALFSMVAFAFTYGGGLVLSSMNWGLLATYAVASMIAAVILSIIAAIYPASFASRMVPATALRTNI